MEGKYGRAHRVWVMDRGLVSESNLAFIRGRGGYYLVGTARSMLKRFQKQLLDGSWSQVCEGIEVQLVDSPDGQETFVLCRSMDRRQKERAIHQRFVQRIESGLTKLDQELAKSCKRRDRGVIERHTWPMPCGRPCRYGWSGLAWQEGFGQCLKSWRG
jgi:hypothetical protein